MLLNAGGLTETNCNIQGSTFKISASPVAFDILCSKLYTNPILAIVRELLTNAYDSQKLAGKEDTPIYVHLPNYMNTNFIIRDYGVGLSKEDVLNIYTSFFSSTKADNNDFTGCFGLGSKTPFSYAPTFSIVSYYEGIKYTFVATKKDGYPHIYPLSEEPTEEVNGLQITIPSSSESYSTYDRRFAEELHAFTAYIPEIRILLASSEGGKKLLKVDTPIVVSENIKLYPENYRYNNTYVIKQGQNAYPVDYYGIHGERCRKYTELFSTNFTILYEVPIGTLSIPPSRESLSKEGNKEKIIVISEDIERVLKNYLKDNLTALAESSTHFRKELVKTQNSLYFDTLVDRPYGYPTLYSKADTGVCATLGYLVDRMKGRSYSSYNNLCTVEQDITNIIITTNYISTKDVNKVERTIENYEELLDSCKVIVPEIYVEGKTSNYVNNIKELKNSIWLLKNNPCYSFNIIHMTLNQFFKKYPNSKKQKEYSVVKDDNPYIRSKAFRLERVNSTYHLTTYGQSIQAIKAKYDNKNTFIIYKDKESTYNTIGRFLNLFCNNFKISYDVSLFTKLLNLVNKDNSTDNIYILEIAKSNKKYFKEYKELTLPIIEQLCYELASNLYLAITEETKYYKPFNIENDVEKLSRLKKFINNISKKKRNIIKASTIYKVLEVVSKTPVEDNTVIRLTTNTTDYKIFTQVLPRYKEFFKTTNNKLYSSILTNILLHLSSNVYRKYVSGVCVKEVLFDRKGNTINKLLKLSKKREPNVLFQRR